MKERVLSASEFKAKCLACCSEVEQSGESITITRRGRPVAVIGPAKRPAFKNFANSWAGRAEILGDIVRPLPGWECVRQQGDRTEAPIAVGHPRSRAMGRRRKEAVPVPAASTRRGR